MTRTFSAPALEPGTRSSPPENAGFPDPEVAGVQVVLKGRGNAGVTLVELSISISLSALVVGMALALYKTSDSLPALGSTGAMRPSGPRHFSFPCPITL